MEASWISYISLASTRVHATTFQFNHSMTWNVHVIRASILELLFDLEAWATSRINLFKLLSKNGVDNRTRMSVKNLRTAIVRGWQHFISYDRHKAVAKIFITPNKLDVAKKTPNLSIRKTLKRLCPSVYWPVWGELKSGKTRIDASAHPSATDIGHTALIWSFVCSSVGRSGGQSVTLDLKSGKTRISAPAHPSATGGRVSGLFIKHDAPFTFTSFNDL